MTALNESIVEDAVLEWFGELGCSWLGAEALTLALCLRPSPLRFGSHGERESYGEVVLVGCLREAIWRLNPAVPHPHPRHLARDAAAEAAERGIGRGSRLVTPMESFKLAFNSHDHTTGTH